GNGEHNVQMITISPQGEIFHVLSGYVGPEELLAELEFAEATWQKLAAIDDAATRKKLLIAEHEKFARELESRNFDESDGIVPGAATAFRNMQKQMQAAFGPEVRLPTAGLIGNRAALDHEFAIDHPLFPSRGDPSPGMVGEGQNFFFSARVAFPYAPES